MINTYYNQFEEAFERVYNGSIYNFMDDLESNRSKLPFECTVEVLDDEEYDSYGNEDTQLKRVVNFPDLDLYVMFTGTRQSHVGEEWDGFREVKPKTHIVQYYE